MTYSGPLIISLSLVTTFYPHFLSFLSGILAGLIIIKIYNSNIHTRHLGYKNAISRRETSSSLITHVQVTHSFFEMRPNVSDVHPHHILIVANMPHITLINTLYSELSLGQKAYHMIGFQIPSEHWSVVTVTDIGV